MRLNLAYLFAAVAAVGMSACGGGVDDSQTAPEPAPAPGPAPQNGFTIAGVELGQALLFPSGDAALVLVSNRAVLAKFNVTANNAANGRPSGVVRIEDGAGRLLRELPLAAPSGALPQHAPLRPSFDDSYTAVIPAVLVQPGMSLIPQLTPAAANQAAIAPRVGGGVTLRLVAVPIQIGSAVGQVVDGAAAHLLARLPVAKVKLEDHAPLVSRAVTQLPKTPAQWSDAFPRILSELDDLRLLENASAHVYYYGFVPKSDSGVGGIGIRPGNVALGVDLPGQPDVAKETMAHELGHNLSLQHAPCGEPVTFDAQYPYANARLGAGGRFIWGYDAQARSFIDPTSTDAHDLMSYCSRAWFSDYSYSKMQAHLASEDSNLDASAGPADLDTVQELLMVSGQIRDGQVQLRPLKPMLGNPRSPVGGGPYLLRITPQQGATIEHRFAASELDHLPQHQRFGFAIAHPGAIAKLEVLLDGRILALKEPRKRAQGAGSEAALPLLQASELGDVLRVTWDAARYPYLAVTHLGAKRTVLGFDLERGSAVLPVSALAPGGRFEFALSDGLNGERVMRNR
jgi:hypothetical protein